MMDATLSGWAVDFLWARMLAKQPASMAVIDAVQIRHTRPVGGGKLYDVVKQLGGKSAWEEYLELPDRHGMIHPHLWDFRWNQTLG
jgi:hypothetical protein